MFELDDAVTLSCVTLVLSFGLTILAACGEDEAAPKLSEIADADAEPPPAPATADAAGGHVIEVDCPPGASVELEDNGSPDKANAFVELSFCGALSPGADVDYSTFTTPAGKKLTRFQAVIDGKVDFELVLGQAILRPSEVDRFEAGTYLVKAFTTDGNPGRYRYRIAFEP